MRTLPLSPWDTYYWSDRLPGRRAEVMEELHPESMLDAEPVKIAMQVAFETRDWELAQHIKRHWIDTLNLNEADNGASLAKRETLFFIRGRTEEKWLDLLLEARVCALDPRGQSVLFEATREIHSQVVDFRDVDHLDHYLIAARKWMGQGANPAEGDPRVIDLVSRVTERLLDLAPSRVDDFTSLRRDMLSSIDRHAEYAQVKKDMLAAIESQDMPALTACTQRFLQIPEASRSWSPIAACLEVFNATSDFEIEAAIGALQRGGWDISGHDIHGETPLYAVLTDEDLTAEFRNGLLRKMLDMGADPSVVNRQGFHHLSTAADTALHGCSLVRDAPITLLVNHGADVDLADIRGMTPLMYASRELYVEMMQDLLMRRANPHKKGPNGQTAAHAFMESCASPVMDTINLDTMVMGAMALHQAGLDFSTPDKSGKTAWQSLLSGADMAGRDDDIAAMLEALESKGVPIPWPHLMEAMGTIQMSTPVHALVDSKVLTLTTPSASSGPSRRRI